MNFMRRSVQYSKRTRQGHIQLPVFRVLLALVLPLLELEVGLGRLSQHTNALDDLVKASDVVDQVRGIANLRNLLWFVQARSRLST